MSITEQATPLTVQSLREKVLRHCDEFLSQPIADRSATGLKAVVEAIVALGSEVEKRSEAASRRLATTGPLPFGLPDHAFDPADHRQQLKDPPIPRRPSLGPTIPGVDG